MNVLFMEKKVNFDLKTPLAVISLTLVFIGLWFIEKGSSIFDGRKIYSLFDDAMISLTYARNLAQGYGLVWNPGDSPVEGYSNPLWTLWMAFLHLGPWTGDTIGFVVSLSGLVILITNVWVVAKIAGDFLSKTKVSILGSACLIAFSYPLLFWTLRGMEVGLLCLWLTE